jgi:hypothetical protein
MTKGFAATLKQADVAGPALLFGNRPDRHIRRIRFRCRPATSCLSALSFVAYRARIPLCQVFHGRPVCRFLDQCFPAHRLFHPVFTSFPDPHRIKHIIKGLTKRRRANRRKIEERSRFRSIDSVSKVNRKLSCHSRMILSGIPFELLTLEKPMDSRRSLTSMIEAGAGMTA